MAASSIQESDGPLWRVADVRQHFKCSPMWIWRRTREAGFPRAVKFGGPRSARFWKREDVLRWADQYAQGRRDAA